MGGLIRRILWPLILIGCALFVGNLLHKNRPQAAKVEEKAVLPAVEVMTAATTDVKVRLPSQGMLEPSMETNAASEVAGRVIKVSPRFEVGESFNKGDILLEIDRSDYEAALAQASSNVADAALAISNEKAEQERYLRNWKKIGNSGKPTDHFLRIPHIASAEARFAAAKAAEAKAEKDLQRTRLRAPYAGKIRSKFTDLGSYITPGAPLAEFYATDFLEVRLPIPLDDASMIENAVGSKVDFTMTNGNETHRWVGTVVRQEGLVDRLSRSLHLITRIEPGKQPAESSRRVSLLSPGLFVSASIEGPVLKNVIPVPRRALLSENEILVLDDESQLQKREVEVLRQDRTHAYLSSGVQPGEPIVVTPLSNPIEGTKVKVIDLKAQPGPPARPPK
ncbi:MAG: efflux RND transporter periplasmic adaptor subunit [Verrucomicrobiota bacterium]